jgi:hypothetical protein
MCCAKKCSGNRVEIGLVPSLIGTTILRLIFICFTWDCKAGSSPLTGAVAFVTDATHWHTHLGYGRSVSLPGHVFGFYSVPLCADEPKIEPTYRARIVAANNISERHFYGDCLY